MKSIGRYQVLEEAGRGGAGVVYKAYDPSLKRQVAVKLLGRLQISHLVRFRREAEACARLQHPNVVRVLDMGELDQCPYLVLEWASGGSLKERIKRTGPMNSRIAAQITLDLAQGLQAAHSLGILHRDINPRNVLFVGERVVLADFGIARLEDGDRLTHTGDLLGTPNYMPPEQVEGQLDCLGPGTDIYSLGATLYEMLTGQPPVTGKSVVQILASVLTNDTIPPSQFCPVDRELEAICLRCLAKSPKGRYSSAQELVEALDSYLTRPVRRGLSVSLPVVLIGLALSLGTLFLGWNMAGGLPPGVTPSPAQESQGQASAEKPAGLVLEYMFLAGAGRTISDTEGKEPLQLDGDPGGFEWISGGGLHIKTHSRATSELTLSRTPIRSCVRTHEITLEVFFDTEEWDQDGPARIVTLSSGAGRRAFLLGLVSTSCAVRLRTSGVPVWNERWNGFPEHRVELKPAPGPFHVAYSFRSGEEARFYVNGQLRPQVQGLGPESEPLPDNLEREGDFSDWFGSDGPPLRLLLFDEYHPTNPQDARPWIGRIYLVAIYDRALSAREILGRYEWAKAAYPHASRN